MKVLKPKEMAERLGVTTRTLRNWDNEGVLKAKRTPTNRRYYTEEQYQRYINSQERSVDSLINVLKEYQKCIPHLSKYIEMMKNDKSLRCGNNE